MLKELITLISLIAKKTFCCLLLYSFFVLLFLHLIFTNAATGRIFIPVESNGVNGGTGTATDVTQDGVWEERCPTETGAFVLAERKVAPLVSDEDHSAKITRVFPRYLDDGLPWEQEDFLQISRSATDVVTPLLSVTDL